MLLLAWIGCLWRTPTTVNVLLWTTLGGVFGALVAIATSRGSRRQAAAPAVDESRRVETRLSPDTQELALSLAEELASLVSAVEARAHHLIEAAPTRTQLPEAAEAMLTSVRRLRNLHTKLIAAGGARPVEAGITDVGELIGGLGEELQLLQLGLELRWDPPPELPSIAADRDAVRDAMLFVCRALLRAERGATRLTFSTERSFALDRPTIKIELNLEWITVPKHSSDAGGIDRAFALNWEAAKQLVHSHGGELTLSHLPGKAVHAVVSYPIAKRAGDDPAEPRLIEDDAAVRDSATVADGGRAEHDYGGALVLESDPALRAVLARELKASGRAVFVCADGESAHTFLKTTPDRFELLLVDDVQELKPHTPLAHTIRAHAPALKICLLTSAPPTEEPTWPDLHTLKKPFGVHELRRTLAMILAED